MSLILFAEPNTFEINQYNMSTSIKYNESRSGETLVTDNPTEIRELVYSAQPAPRYLVLVICAKHFKVFEGNDHQLKELPASIPDHVAAYKNDIAEKVTNFSDVSDRKEIMLDKFLRQADSELTQVRVDSCPVFILGTKRTTGHFKKISHNTKGIIEYIHGNYDEATVPELTRLLDPHVAGLVKARQTDLVKQLDDAMNAHKLVWGIHDVWRYAMQNKGRLMVVEDNYYYPSGEDGTPIHFSEHGAEGEHQYYLKDAVDVLIEKVLKGGGKVEFVDKGLLDNYNSIALIQYY